MAAHWDCCQGVGEYGYCLRLRHQGMRDRAWAHLPIAIVRCQQLANQRRPPTNSSATLPQRDPRIEEIACCLLPPLSFVHGEIANPAHERQAVAQTSQEPLVVSPQVAAEALR
jgi:hypothetical protein